MDYTGPPQILLTALYIFIVLAIAAIALWRGERARSQHAKELTRIWTRRAYRCFLTLGVLGAFIAAILIGTTRLSFAEQQGWGMFAGFVGGVPAAIALLVGTFHALMVWRARLIRLLLLATVAFLSIFFTANVLSTPILVAPWDSIVATGYCLFVIGVSVRGLIGLRTCVTS